MAKWCVYHDEEGGYEIKMGFENMGFNKTMNLELDKVHWRKNIMQHIFKILSALAIDI